METMLTIILNPSNHPGAPKRVELWAFVVLDSSDPRMKCGWRYLMSILVRRFVNGLHLDVLHQVLVISKIATASKHSFVIDFIQSLNVSEASHRSITGQHVSSQYDAFVKNNPQDGCARGWWWLGVLFSKPIVVLELCFSHFRRNKFTSLEQKSRNEKCNAM